jgi:hypothetical protein
MQAPSISHIDVHVPASIAVRTFVKHAEGSENEKCVFFSTPRASVGQNRSLNFSCAVLTHYPGQGSSLHIPLSLFNRSNPGEMTIYMYVPWFICMYIDRYIGA